MCAATYKLLFCRACQLEIHPVSTLPAAWKYPFAKQRGFVHQPVRIVENTINAALWNGITWAKISFHATPHAHAAKSTPTGARTPTLRLGGQRCRLPPTGCPAATPTSKAGGALCKTSGENSVVVLITMSQNVEYYFSRSHEALH